MQIEIVSLFLCELRTERGKRKSRGELWTHTTNTSPCFCFYMGGCVYIRNAFTEIEMLEEGGGENRVCSQVSTLQGQISSACLGVKLLLEQNTDQIIFAYFCSALSSFPPLRFFLAPELNLIISFPAVSQIDMGVGLLQDITTVRIFLGCPIIYQVLYVRTI